MFDEIKLADRVVLAILTGQRIMGVEMGENKLYLHLESGELLCLSGSTFGLEVAKLIKRTDELEDPDATKNTN